MNNYLYKFLLTGTLLFGGIDGMQQSSLGPLRVISIAIAMPPTIVQHITRPALWIFMQSKAHPVLATVVCVACLCGAIYSYQRGHFHRFGTYIMNHCTCCGRFLVQLLSRRRRDPEDRVSFLEHSQQPLPERKESEKERQKQLKIEAEKQLQKDILEALGQPKPRQMLINLGQLIRPFSKIDAQYLDITSAIEKEICSVVPQILAETALLNIDSSAPSEQLKQEILQSHREHLLQRIALVKRSIAQYNALENCFVLAHLQYMLAVISTADEQPFRFSACQQSLGETLKYKNNDKELAIVKYYQARILLAQNKVNDALHCAEEGLASDNRNVDLLLLSAQCHLACHDLNRAQQCASRTSCIPADETVSIAMFENLIKGLVFQYKIASEMQKVENASEIEYKLEPVFQSYFQALEGVTFSSRATSKAIIPVFEAHETSIVQDFDKIIQECAFETYQSLCQFNLAFIKSTMAQKYTYHYARYIGTLIIGDCLKEMIKHGVLQKADQDRFINELLRYLPCVPSCIPEAETWSRAFTQVQEPLYHAYLKVMDGENESGAEATASASAAASAQQ